MPRFLIVTRRATPTALQRATGMLNARFPEISVEWRGHTDDNDNDDICMICDAPSAEHARRWLRDADIDTRSITTHPGHLPARPSLTLG